MSHSREHSTPKSTNVEQWVVDPREALAFDKEGGVVTINIASTAPDEVVQKVTKDLEKSSPSYLGMTNAVKLELEVLKI